MPNHVGPVALSAKEHVEVATSALAEAYNSREPARITALYDPSALFWGTTAKTVATTHAAVAQRFKNAPKTRGARVVLGEQHIRVFGDFALNTGY